MAHDPATAASALAATAQTVDNSKKEAAVVMSFDLLFLVAAVICFVIATFGKSWGGINYVALGLAFFVLTYLI